MTNANLDRLIVGHLLLHDVHVAFLELADQPMINVLLSHAADEILSQLLELALGKVTPLQANLERTPRVAAEDSPDTVPLDDHLLAGRSRALEDLAVLDLDLGPVDGVLNLAHLRNGFLGGGEPQGADGRRYGRSQGRPGRDDQGGYDQYAAHRDSPRLGKSSRDPDTFSAVR